MTHAFRVELLADLDASSQTPLPPPRGADACKVLMHQRRRAVGEKLVEIFGHG
jgi:hypothetical protein